MRKITDDQELPEPFRTFWTTTNLIKEIRKEWAFFVDKDNNLYILQNPESYFADYWKSTHCVHVDTFMVENKINCDNIPHIACIECDNKEFTLYFGDYELIAKCKCGIQEIVYDG